MSLRKKGLVFFLCLLLSFTTYSQTDSIEIKKDSIFHSSDLSKLDQKSISQLDPTRKTWIKKNPTKALVVPIGLVGLGAILIKNPVYDRFDFKRDLNNTFHNFGGTKVDDYLIFAPYVELVALNLVKIKCENDLINTSLIILKAEIINTGLTFGVKYLTNITRPNGERYAWPSGHTSQAFLAATIVHREFRYKSPWYGIAAYGIAGTVGLFRMLNNKHWLSDVVAGAGFGIFSANLAYLTHRWRWGRPGTCLVPSYMNGRPGIILVQQF